MKRIGEEKIGYILSRNLPPQPQDERIAQLKGEIKLRAQTQATGILQKISLPDMLLRQIPYIAGWVWAVQGFAVFLFALLLQENFESVEPIFLMSLTGPVLALLLVVDILRSFGCNMWEMEAACRFDLRRLTAMRMCIVGITDGAVLTAGCVLYGRKAGNIWEFGLFVILPFLVSSSVYLWELNYFSPICSASVMAATGIALMLIGCQALRPLYGMMLVRYLKWAPAGIAGAAVFFGMVTIYLAVRLCNGLKNRRGERKRWSLE